MNEYNYEMVIYFEKDILVGVMYDNKKNVICKSDDIGFWLRKYHNILDTLKDSSILYINFSPISRKYKGMIIRHYKNFYNEYKRELIKEADGVSFKNCLGLLDQNICRILNKDLKK